MLGAIVFLLHAQHAHETRNTDPESDMTDVIVSCERVINKTKQNILIYSYKKISFFFHIGSLRSMIPRRERSKVDWFLVTLILKRVIRVWSVNTLNVISSPLPLTNQTRVKA